jgi:hypothetical protein
MLRSSASRALKTLLFAMICRFYLVNIMMDLQVLYLRGKDFRSAQVLASLRLPQTTPNIPLSVHLSPTTTSSAMKAIWSTRDPAGQPTVRWGTAPGRYQHKAAGSITTIKASDLCNSPANSTGFVDPKSINSAIMSNLRPGTRYYYSVGDAVLGYSQQFSFITPPRPSRSNYYQQLVASGTAASAESTPDAEHDTTDNQDAAGSSPEAAAAATTAAIVSSGGIQTHHYKPAVHKSPHYPGASSCFKRPYGWQCRNDASQPMHILAWADMGAFNRDNSRWVPGTFGDQIGADVRRACS